MAESSAKRLLAVGGEAHDARALGPPRPAEIQTTTQHGRTDGSGEVMPAHAPVQARPAQRAPLTRERLDVDPDLQQESLALPCQFRAIAAGSQVAPLLEAVKDEDAQLTGKMVVADTRLPQRGLPGD